MKWLCEFFFCYVFLLVEMNCDWFFLKWNKVVGDLKEIVCMKVM